MNLKGLSSVILFSAAVLTGCQPNYTTIPNHDFACSFDHPPYLNPRIIQDLSTWISDSEDQVVAINVLAAQHSNQFFADVQTRQITNASPYVYFQDESGTEFGYQFIGKTSSDIYVLETVSVSGGSGDFRNLMLVKFVSDRGMSCDWKRGELKPGPKRLLIKKVGEIALGDRWDGKLTIRGDSICVGKDHGWFSVSGGSGGRDLKPRELTILMH